MKRSAYTGTLGTGGLGGAAGAVVVSEWQVVLSVGEVTALLELGGPAAIDTLTATCGVLIERELAAVQTHLQSRQTSLARLMQMVGGAAAAGGDVRGAQQLQAQVSSLVHAKQGLYSAWEMAKVQASVQQLARCLAFRCSMLACALDEAAKAHMFTWAETLRHFNLPSTVAPPPPITAVTLTQSERELSEALGEMVMCEGGVEWSEMVRPVQTVGKGSREGEGVGGGGAEGSGMDTGLHYNDLWKVCVCVCPLLALLHLRMDHARMSMHLKSTLPALTSTHAKACMYLYVCAHVCVCVYVCVCVCALTGGASCGSCTVGSCTCGLTPSTSVVRCGSMCVCVCVSLCVRMCGMCAWVYLACKSACTCD